ncbi:inactive protein RESTRICTED TEV MOVEMENT 2-like [Cucumis melo var. makuwa]|uniref:Inactive protein RESTRICTED TEV MOVEMENT 2-like n=1 Tax=Cucumis melo var. makuwa TaxID=1194695 RepID=A0A5D3CDK6_CUCMM|nr:inactive protein RESTRICTED TEV MOVEMENT 2-like [Cucumis melo var. makuwa]
MDPSSSAKNFEEFEPRFDWVHHPDSHVLVVHLSGFRSNQLKVQVTSTGKLRVSGERKLGNGKWLRFEKEIDIPADADTDKISAKLEEGILYVKQPKKLPTTSSNIPPVQQPKPKAQSQPPPAATKPTADPPTVRPSVPKSRNERAEPPKPAATEPTVAPPTVGPKAPESQNERADIPSTDAKKTNVKNYAPRPTVGPNAPKSQNDRPQSQASGKQIPTPPKPEEATGAPSMGSGQPVEDLAKKDKTEEKGKAHTKLQDALEKTREEGKEEEGGSKKAEEQKEEVGEEKRRRRRMKRRNEEMGEESGRLRRREGYKQVIDGVVKEIRTNMVTLALGVAVFAILYLNLSENGHI